MLIKIKLNTLQKTYIVINYLLVNNPKRVNSQSSHNPKHGEKCKYGIAQFLVSSILRHFRSLKTNVITNRLWTFSNKLPPTKYLHNREQLAPCCLSCAGLPPTIRPSEQSSQYGVWTSAKNPYVSHRRTGSPSMTSRMT